MFTQAPHVCRRGRAVAGIGGRAVTTPTPKALAVNQVEPSNGPSGDAQVDSALGELSRVAHDFTASELHSADAASVIEASWALNDALQARLEGAAGS